MSCPPFKLLAPYGGLLRTISCEEFFKKYVRLEYPLGNCFNFRLLVSILLFCKNTFRFSKGNSSPERIFLGISSSKPGVFLF